MIVCILCWCGGALRRQSALPLLWAGYLVRTFARNQRRRTYMQHMTAKRSSNLIVCLVKLRNEHSCLRVLRVTVLCAQSSACLVAGGCVQVTAVMFALTLPLLGPCSNAIVIRRTNKIALKN